MLPVLMPFLFSFSSRNKLCLSKVSAIICDLVTKQVNLWDQSPFNLEHTGILSICWDSQRFRLH